MFDRDAARSWLTILHGDAPGLTHVCSTGDWGGQAFDDADAAADYIAHLDGLGREGIYARVTTLREPPPVDAAGRRSRGGVELTMALPALWADIDVAGPGHAPPAGGLPLPDSLQAAALIIATSGLPEPTIWVHSGGGMYPVWMLTEPHVVPVGNPNEHRAAIRELGELSASWQRVIGLAAASLGWHYGTGVGDLARVLRVPGTVNRKAGLERPCRIVGGSERRYALDELATALADALTALEPESDEVGPLGSSARAAESRRSDSAASRGSMGGTTPHPSSARGPGAGSLSPADDYEARADWADILRPHGWRQAGPPRATPHGPVRYWKRPGKTTVGISATTNALGTDRLRVFSTEAWPFEARSYGKLGALATLEFAGDVTAAARHLASQGYGYRPDVAADHLAAIADIIGPAPHTSPRAGPVLKGTAVSSAIPTDASRLPDGERAAAAPTQTTEISSADEAARLEAEIRHRMAVASEAARIRVRREATRLVEAEEAARSWRVPPNRPDLAVELQLPDDPLAYRIERLLPVGGNALLAAAYKAGKTTLCNELVRCLADGDSFLGRFKVDPPDGRVAIFNYEVGPSQYRTWLRELGIVNPERIVLLNLRGFTMPILAPHVTDWVIRWLAEHDVRIWIVDPFARAFVGSGDENSNSDVGVFLDQLDVIKERAGVTELVMPTHTGRAEQEAGQERARGATRLDDWADARWILTLDDKRRRYFRAAGRDVEVDEELLKFDQDTRRLTMGGWDRYGQRQRDLTDEVVAWVQANPGEGVNEIVKGVGRNRNHVSAALNQAINERHVIAVEGERGRRRHYAPGGNNNGGRG